ncbi:hypothetical protein FACS1894137_16670 [Spirochaetia bacterium]|nr:hypothetical protein FACS1894137_16670 [Spirochaetia bacterium]
MKKPVPLSPDERERLAALAEGAPTGTSAEEARHVRLRAKALLLLHEQGRLMDIAAACGCTQNTVLNIRRRYFKEGLEAALIHKPYNTNILTPEMAERVVALSRSAPPAGHRRWTLTLLTKAVIEQGIVESLSYPTVARTLRKYYPSPATRLPAAVPVIKKPRKKAARLPLTLKPGEQERLEEMVNAKEEPPRWAAWQTLRAEVMLHLARTPPLTKRQAADLCHCSPTLIDTVIRQYETDGLERVLTQQRGTWTGEKKDDRRKVHKIEKFPLHSFPFRSIF